MFNNSFNQFSQYLYGGKLWNFHGKWEGFNAKITAGLIHGYKGEFKDKIPNNGEGIAPAIIPGIGYRKGRFGGNIYVLGISGLLFTALNAMRHGRTCCSRPASTSDHREQRGACNEAPRGRDTEYGNLCLPVMRIAYSAGSTAIAMASV